MIVPVISSDWKKKEAKNNWCCFYLRIGSVLWLHHHASCYLLQLIYCPCLDDRLVATIFQIHVVSVEGDCPVLLDLMANSIIGY